MNGDLMVLLSLIAVPKAQYGRMIFERRRLCTALVQWAT